RGARLLERDAGLERAERAEPMEVARHVLGLERERPPDLPLLAVEGAAAREHAYYRVRLAVERYRLTHDRGIAAEPRLPEPIAQEHHVVVSHLVLARQKLAAEQDRRARD